MKFTKLFTLLLFTFCIISCDTDDGILGERPDNPNSGNFSDNFGSAINRDFLGRVIDINSNPIQDVSITIGNATATTDANGVFIINNAPVFQNFGYVKADKEGYIHGSRAVVPSNGTNKVTIMLLEETVVETINSGEVTTVALPSGASASFDGNFKTDNGTDYTGSVDVIMHLLDATDENIELQMPGMLYAENAEGNERMLQTLGMLAVELRGDSGQELNLADGSTSEIRIPLDASLVATAPATIPLWSFDEANGYWKEEGQANLVGNEYIGTVSHFSFWNCDIPAEAVNLCVTVSDEDQNALANLQINITSATYGTRSGYTNGNGEVCGLVPSNETLTIEVLDFDTCGSNAIYSASIGPFASDSSINITIQSSQDIISEAVTGIFNNCDGNPVTNGYVVLTYGSQQFFDFVDNGNFEINMVRCTDDNSFTIEAVDVDSIQSSGEINYTFTTPSTNIGTIASCNTVDEFISFQVDSDIVITYFTNLGYDFGPPSIYLSGSVETDIEISELYLSIPDNVVGTYDSATGSDISLSFNDGSGSSTNQNTPDLMLIVNLTAFGNVGEYIDVNFSGTYTGIDGNTHSITGTIHKIRDF